MKRNIFSHVRRICTSFWITLALSLLAVGYLSPKIFLFRADEALDFRLVWLAGRIWASGGDPYGPNFLREYLQFFGEGPNTHFWVYPPYWYPIALPLSYLQFDVAARFWKFLNLALLIIATHFTARVLVINSRVKYWSTFLFGFAFASFMQATTVTFSIGQTSALVYFGFSALAYGLCLQRPDIITVALLFLILKPNIGVVGLAAILAIRKFRAVTLLIIVICALASSPFLGSDSFLTQAKNFLSNLSRYSNPEFTANTPPNLAGAAHLLDFLSMGSGVFILLAVAAAFALLRLTAKQTDKQVQLSLWALFVAATLFIIPLHSYDMLPLASIAMIAFTRREFNAGWILTVGGLALCIRGGNFARISGIMRSDSIIFPDSLLMSIGLFLIFGGCAWSALRDMAMSTREAASY